MIQPEEASQCQVDDSDPEMSPWRYRLLYVGVYAMGLLALLVFPAIALVASFRMARVYVRSCMD